MTYKEQISSQLNVMPLQVEAVIKLLDDGNTIPFIARYRKEHTGSLDEEQLRNIETILGRLRTLDTRRKTIVSTIEGQEKMTPQLLTQIEGADTMTALEDLYQPYKPKRRTRASAAREKGLQALADMILDQNITPGSPEQAAKEYISENVPSIEEALKGARDIAAESISDHSDVRRVTREKAWKWGTLACERISSGEDDRQIYERYYEYNQRINRMRPHQTLAINRGENAKILRVRVDVPERDWYNAILGSFQPVKQSPFYNLLILTIQDAAARLLLPAIGRDTRRMLTEKAESQAVQVFAANLKGLLNQPPLKGQVVMGIDPGFRTGSKVAVVDDTGMVLDTVTVYPHPPQKKRQETMNELQRMIKERQVTLVAIGNGTASRETEQLVAEIVNADVEQDLHYVIANEAGASVYSASPLARSELPDMDVSMRGAVSIARRVQDPLAELVKIDPKSIGVGMYQHDVNQLEMAHTLDGVVEDVVNRVGVYVNTASVALLAHVAGISSKVAENIVAHRNANGTYKDRQEFREIKGMGAKGFEQSAGFLRINEGKEALDASAIHPESYPAAVAVLEKAGVTMNDPAECRKNALSSLRDRVSIEKLADELVCGVPTLEDIFEQLHRPGRDPREDYPAPVLRSDVLSMDDLSIGMQLNGTVRNVVDFGAFIDIGVKQDGLAHRSQIPREISLGVGDVVEVEVLKIEVERGRISLMVVDPSRK
jgi:protein Tex